VAITYGVQQWTWAQWADRVRRAAGGLRAAGVGRGDRVAFLDKNHPACLELTFAAASLGAAIAILNWRMAPDEVAFALDDSGARVLFAGAELPTAAEAQLLTSGPERVIIVGGEHDEYEQFLEEAEPAPPSSDVEPSDTALVIYSSGTTGRPKGVLLSQRALVSHTVNVGTAFPMGPGDRNLVAMPLFHVGGVCYAFFGIRAGVPSIMTREPDAASLTAAMAAGATHGFFVPPVIAGFLAAGTPGIAAMSPLKRLGYGAAPMPLPPHRQHLLLSAGTPVPGAEVRIADVVSGREVATGEQGEIWLRSEQSMTGYLNQPEATAETITPDGWVRTGDIGRIDADGYVYVEDRLKDMIITGGENVYGPEVERVLMAHPAVADAAIIGVPDEHWGESVKAIVTTSAEVSAEAIIAHCREYLAGYKCPRTVDFVDALPRNPSGKIVKHELRQSHWEGQGRSI